MTAKSRAEKFARHQRYPRQSANQSVQAAPGGELQRILPDESWLASQTQIAKARQALSDPSNADAAPVAMRSRNLPARSPALRASSAVYSRHNHAARSRAARTQAAPRGDRNRV